MCSVERPLAGPASAHSPVVPVVTVVTPDHGTPIVRLVTSWTDPDLISPLISDLRVLFLFLFFGGRDRDGMGKKNQRESRMRMIT